MKKKTKTKTKTKGTRAKKPAKATKTKAKAKAKREPLIRNGDFVKTKAPTKAVKAPKDAADPAKEKLQEHGGKQALKGDADAGVPKGNIDLRKLERATMKGMAKDLDVHYTKTMTDDELRAALAKTMVGIDATVMAKIASADPAKLDALHDCIGVAIDLTKAICITCPAQEDCRKLFNIHKEDGWKIFDQLQPGSTTKIDENMAKLIPAEALTKPKKVKEAAKPVAPTFDPAQVVENYEIGKVAKLPMVKVDGGEVDNAGHKQFLIDVKKTSPETLGEFRDIVLRHYDADEDDDKDAVALTMWFVRYCVALDMITLA